MPVKLEGRTYYNTQEACTIAGTNKYTYLRWVRQRKVIDVVNRDRNGWRLFTEEDLCRLKSQVNHIERVKNS
jgi:hypothetical protein